MAQHPPPKGPGPSDYVGLAVLGFLALLLYAHLDNAAERRARETPPAWMAAYPATMP